MSGRTYGTAGVGVATGQWVQNRGVARAGAQGERLTARELAKLVERSNVTVLHDLKMPVPNITANIDHVVVSGRTVWLIDSKMWKPGFLWTVGGHTRRGKDLFPSADKQTMVMARTGIERFLTGTDAHVRTPLVAIWSTNRDLPWLWALRIPGARAVHGHRLLLHLPGDGQPADPAIVAQLQRLMNLPKGR